MSLTIKSHKNVKFYSKEWKREKDIDYVFYNTRIMLTEKNLYKNEKLKNILKFIKHCHENYLYDVGLYFNPSIAKTVRKTGKYTAEITNYDKPRIDIGYENYNQSRRILGKFFGIESLEDFWNNPNKNVPLFELFYFSDSDGAFDNECCRKLYNDLKYNYKFLKSYRTKNKQYLVWFYKSLMEVFGYAAENNGCVTFS